MGVPSGQRRDGITDPNLTPLIDVSLVLVVILMVATPLVFQSGIAVQTAGAAGKTAAAATHEDRIELTVLPNAQVRLNRVVVAREHLAAILRPLLIESATRLVVVRCDDTVSHGEFVSVLDEARALGAARLAIVEN
ncbi:MAG TPA: biopolymer transporter ExbD [Candidatus Eisenbacteria bacterium]|jgi:biopolymer transport protein ExbD